MMRQNGLLKVHDMSFCGKKMVKITQLANELEIMTFRCKYKTSLTEMTC